MRFMKLKYLGFAFLFLFSWPLYSAVHLKIAIEKGEYWWIGIVNHGNLQPLKNGYQADLSANLYGNQSQPLLLSSTGKIIWSDEPFGIEMNNDSLYLVKSSGEFVYKKVATDLRNAFLYASKTFFPPSGKMPDELMFTKPQYNTWIELLYNQNQHDVLQYAGNILKNNFPAGVIMIDDNWQEDYGKWQFHPARFPNPKVMIDSLHHMGFKVMVWICPFVSADSDVGRMLANKQALLKTETGDTKIIHWWNGYSSVLDLSNPVAVEWFKSQLDHLRNDFGVDGFKFDAGDPEYYLDGVSAGNITPNQHCELFSKIGLEYGFNEYRATWKMGGQPLAQRLRDKGHSWEDLQTLMPNILLQGMMGYPFTCPDMIGGGEMGSFQNLSKVDQDLIVRSAQCHAFMPMMQFSVAPWRVLDEAHFAAVQQTVNLRMKYIGVILELARNATQNGEPIVRTMEYEFPHNQYESITNQFMLGDKMLIAPFVDNKLGYREVVIPKGKWQDDKGKTITGPQTIKILSELERIPFYIKIK